MTIKLPLNSMPPVRAYPNDLFLNAILSANCGNSLLFAHLSVEGFCIDKYEVSHTNNSDVIINGHTVEFYGNKSANNAIAVIHQKIDKHKEYIVRVHSHQYNSDWSTINVFTAHQFYFGGENDSNCRVGLFSNNHVCCDCDGEIHPAIANKFKSQNEYYLKLSVKDDIVSGWISLDGKEWDRLCESKPSNTENLIIGIEFNFAPNLYWAWLYSNYIHFAYTDNEEVHAWYLSAPRRYYSYCTFNPLVMFVRERVDFLLEKYESIVEYIKLNIQKGRYVELYFDEYYVPQMNTYNKKHFLHGDLAYGFDDTHIYFLGVHHGKPLEFKLTYNDVVAGSKSALELDPYNLLTVYQFNPDEYSFSITALYKSLRDYLIGIIDNIESYNIDSKEYAYDISAFNKFVNDVGLKNLMADVRISFLIKEHTQLMRERVKYLIDSDILTKNESEDVLDMLDDLCDCTNKVLLLTLKYSMTGADNIMLKVSTKLKYIQFQQKNCYSKLLCLLKKHVNKDRIEFFGEFN